MPKSVLDKIISSIRNQPHSSPNGVSRVAIAKYLKNELEYDNASALKKALKKGVASGKLIQTGQSFRVASDPVAELPVQPKVEIEDVKEGNGPSATKGDTVVVKYVGTLKREGTVFDAASSFQFTIGAGDVIKGWDAGIEGMKVGGKRFLEVPSKLAYGKRGSAPGIPPDADLIFTVTLKSIKE
jgi:FKBP-type peptidyl-prolyl cis-trans isomerase